MGEIQSTPVDIKDRTCVEVFDASGVLVERSYSPTPTELQELHNNHKCGAFCDICYHEAMVSIGLE